MMMPPVPSWQTLFEATIGDLVKAIWRCNETLYTLYSNDILGGVIVSSLKRIRSSCSCVDTKLFFFSFFLPFYIFSIPSCVIIKTPLVRKTAGNHLIKSISLEKNSQHCLWFLLRSKSSMRSSIATASFYQDLVKATDDAIISLKTL